MLRQCPDHELKSTHCCKCEDLLPQKNKKCFCLILFFVARIGHNFEDNWGEDGKSTLDQAM